MKHSSSTARYVVKQPRSSAKNLLNNLWAMSMIIAYLATILWLVASIQAEAIDNEADELVMVGVGAWEASESEQSSAAAPVPEAPEEAAWEEEEWPTVAATQEEPTSMAAEPCEEGEQDDDDDDWLQDGFEQEEEEWTLLEADEDA